MEKILNKVTDQNSVGVIVYRPGGGVVYANELILNLLKYSEKELTGTETVARLYHPDDYEQVTTSQARLLAAQSKREEGKWRFISKEDNIYEADTIITIEVDDDNDDTGLILFQLNNITEVSGKLHSKSTENIQQLLSNFNITPETGVLVAEASSGAFVYMNDLLLNWLGYKQNEIIKLKSKDIIHKDDFLKVRKNNIKIYLGMKDSGLTVKYLSQDGLEVFLSQQVSKISIKDLKKNYFVVLYEKASNPIMA